ncbi:MAG: hypothetical protein H0V53_14030 [Rubrobacter sp.]|nr:hypothetical protein [Rubrobacter sp.]
MTQEQNVKRGVSIGRELAEEADALAREMGVTRSRLYSMALRDFMRRRENAGLLERLNEAYREPDPGDEALIEGAKRYSRRLLDEEER